MSDRVFDKLSAGVGDINIAIATDSMGSGDPNIGRRVAQKFAAMYPELKVIYRRYAMPGQGESNLAQNIQVGTSTQTLTVWNGCAPGQTLTYQTTNFDDIWPAGTVIDVMMIITGHTNGMATASELVLKITNFITFTRSKSPGADIWISTENAQTDVVWEDGRVLHYERQLAIRDFANTSSYPYIPILEAFDERQPEWSALIQPDGIHPTNGTTGGYDLWADTVDTFIDGLAPEPLPPLLPSPIWNTYDATNWQDGQAGGTMVTASRLNNMEQGILDSQLLFGLTTIVAAGPGIDPSGRTDSSVAMQAMVIEAQKTGRKLLLPPGTYKASVITDIMIQQPVIEGSGGNVTMWNAASPDKPAITMQGVSGAQSYGRIRNMRIAGGSGGTAIELQGTIGVFIENCDITASAIGVLFHNKKGTNGAYAGYAGDYTEFCQVINSTFRQGVVTQIEYRRTGGHASFHGTGFRNTIFNQTSGAWGRDNVMVGVGCTVYNAPWDGMFFIGNPGRPPIRNYSSTPVRVNGNLTFEARPGVVQTMVANGSAAPVYLAGNLNRLSSNAGQVRRGIRLYLVDDVTYYGVTSTKATFHKRPYEYEQALSAGTNYIYEINVNGGSSATLVAVNLVGPNYNRHALLYITLNSSATGGTVQVLSTGYVYDGNNVGAPAFSMSDMNLVITRSGLPAGTVAHMKITHQFSNYASSLV